MPSFLGPIRDYFTFSASEAVFGDLRFPTGPPRDHSRIADFLPRADHSRLAVALPLPDKVISKGFPAVSVTFHLPSNWLAAKQGTPVVSMAKIATRIVLVNLPNPLGCWASHVGEGYIERTKAKVSKKA